MPKITDLAGMRQYVLRKLGSPVIQVEMSVEQLEDSIYDSVQFFQTHHTGEGNYRDFMGLAIEVGTSAYDMSNLNIEAVLDTPLTFYDDRGISTLFTNTHNLLYEDWVVNGGYPGGPGGGIQGVVGGIRGRPDP